jgi:hypothetical protein
MRVFYNSSSLKLLNLLTLWIDWSVISNLDLASFIDLLRELLAKLNVLWEDFLKDEVSFSILLFLDLRDLLLDFDYSFFLFDRFYLKL